MNLIPTPILLTMGISHFRIVTFMYHTKPLQLIHELLTLNTIIFIFISEILTKISLLEGTVKHSENISLFLCKKVHFNTADQGYINF